MLPALRITFINKWFQKLFRVCERAERWPCGKKNIYCFYYYCSFDYIYFFIGNTRGYLHAHKKELVEREKLKVKTYNSERKILEEARGDRNYVMLYILHSVNRSRHSYFLPLEEFILPDMQLWYNSEWGKAMKQFLRVILFLKKVHFQN